MNKSWENLISYNDLYYTICKRLLDLREIRTDENLNIQGFTKSTGNGKKKGILKVNFFFVILL